MRGRGARSTRFLLLDLFCAPLARAFPLNLSLPCSPQPPSRSAVSLWGNDGDVPTVVLLEKSSNTPLFTYITPGSMSAVDLNVVADASGGTTIFLGAAGKAVPANKFGNGGNAFGWRITV